MSEAPKFVQKVQPIYVDENGDIIIHQSEGLPYRDVALYDLFTINDDAVDTNVYTVADWGVGLDFFLKSVGIALLEDTTTNEPNRIHGDGVYVWIEYMIGATTNYIFLKTIRDRFIDEDGGGWYWQNSWVFDLIRVPAGVNLTTASINRSGERLRFEISLRGVAV